MGESSRHWHLFQKRSLKLTSLLTRPQTSPLVIYISFQCLVMRTLLPKALKKSTRVEVIFGWHWLWFKHLIAGRRLLEVISLCLIWNCAYTSWLLRQPDCQLQYTCQEYRLAQGGIWWSACCANMQQCIRHIFMYTISGEKLSKNIHEL